MLNQNTVSGILGKNTTIGKNSIVDRFTSIGDETFINTNCMITKATIGNYCSIGSNVVIGPGEHSLKKISLSGRFYIDTYNTLTKRECEIEHDVWIGTHAIILRGVKIGTGAVVGANSVVTKDVPPYAVVVGSPAKVIKYRFNKEKILKILNSNWFLEDLENAKKIIERLESES